MATRQRKQAVAVRPLPAWQPKLVTPVLPVVHRVITRFLLDQAGLKADEADGGAVTLIQPIVHGWGSAANLNTHRHCLVLDGVYRRGTDGEPVFVEVPPPTDEALQAVLHKIITRTMKLLTRRGVLIEEHGKTYMADGDADCAAFLTKTMAFTGIPRELAEWVDAMQLSPYALISALVLIYLVLGTALDGISMIVLTSAVVLPMIQKAGFDLIWFGIFIVLLVEIAEVTPPVGFNLFVLQNMTGKDSNVIARAAIPFFACMVICIALITLFPQIVTVLPDLVMGKEK